MVYPGREGTTPIAIIYHNLKYLSDTSAAYSCLVIIHWAVPGAQLTVMDLCGMLKGFPSAQSGRSLAGKPAFSLENWCWKMDWLKGKSMGNHGFLAPSIRGGSVNPILGCLITWSYFAITTCVGCVHMFARDGCCRLFWLGSHCC